MKFAIMLFFLGLFIATLAGQSERSTQEFSITLERAACLGECPEYRVTIRRDGSGVFEGHEYVRVKGARKFSLPPAEVDSLIRKLRDENFLHWREEHRVCLDFPEVHITANFMGHQKHVLEGCNRPGKVLRLAEEIDRICRDERWVGTRH